jgi:hypothetical protein
MLELPPQAAVGLKRQTGSFAALRMTAGGITETRRRRGLKTDGRGAEDRGVRDGELVDGIASFASRIDCTDRADSMTRLWILRCPSDDRMVRHGVQVGSP